ncbi:MAG: rod shape-determining protein MreC [Nocardioidaceae bacterium]
MGSRIAIGLLVLACVTIITVDSRHGSVGSPVQPLRTAVGGVMGPVEDGAASALRPFTEIPDHFGDVKTLRQQNAALQATNHALAARLHAVSANANRGNEMRGISEFASTSGFGVVPAQVVALGPAQSFTRTVTIDAGTNDGVAPDLTVINADGLVGRVVAATASTATVLLIVDSESTVGGRLGESMELGFLDGRGDVSGDGTLAFSLVDHTVSPHLGDPVLTWGSRGNAPYVPGIPIGTVVAVHSSPAELTQVAQVRPYVDFSSLDVVAVITKAHVKSTHTDLASRVSR